MTRALFDSPYIFGIHEPGGENHMMVAGKPGWILFTESLGHDPNDRSGKDFTAHSGRGLGVMCRLNHGYYPHGTLPHSRFYPEFARRCARFVAASPGCKIWILGNEMNYAIERSQTMDWASSGTQNGAQSRMPRSGTPSPGPGMSGPGGWPVLKRLFSSRSPSGSRRAAAPNGSGGETIPQELSAVLLQPPKDDPFLRGLPERFSAIHTTSGSGPQVAGGSIGPGEVITPALYARCYNLCRDAIHGVPGHQNDQVVVGAVAPWNNQTTYEGNPTGDWIVYFKDILTLLGPAHCDGFAIHTYTHTSDPNLIYSDARLHAPYQDRHFEFRAYRDFMTAVPVSMRHLPAYITETNQDQPWQDQNSGWVQRAYGEIDWWNKQLGNQQIRSLVLYRWPRLDRWYIEGKQGVVSDFQATLKNDYRWHVSLPPAAPWQRGDLVQCVDVVNLRATPGVAGKLPDDVLAKLPIGSTLTIRDNAFRMADDLVWWKVQIEQKEPEPLSGWLAQFAPTGQILLIEGKRPAPAPDPKPLPDPVPQPIDLRPGDQARTLALVRLRRSPGYVDKPEGDVLAEVPINTVVHLEEGPVTVDDLAWWRLETVTVEASGQQGWMAHTAPNGIPLLGKAAAAPPPPPPPFHPGDLVVAADTLRARRTPGFMEKEDGDVVGEFMPRTSLYIVSGPERVHDLNWWQVGGILSTSQETVAWVVQAAPNGVALLTRPARLPGTRIPDPKEGIYLGTPYVGRFPISQLWGEHASFYLRYLYDGVPLKGHNGLDFPMPVGTPVLGTDAGQVMFVGFEPAGFGHWVRMKHSWGESLYAHLDRVNVMQGQVVRRGVMVGASGNTGTSDAPHLHFTIRVNPYDRQDGWGGFTDPLAYLNPAHLIMPDYGLEQRAVGGPTRGAVIRPAKMPPPAMVVEIPGMARP